MSKLISVKVRDEIFEETEHLLRRSGKRRNAYINEALGFYNALWQRKLLKKRLRTESAVVAQDSLAVLEEFEQIDDANQ